MAYPGLLILGETNHDRGIQLESLTISLLQSIGYSNVTDRVRGAGGDEVDVKANREVPDLGGVRVDKVICECKAIRKSVDMTDWLKFLGKVLVEQSAEHNRVSGFFIALSGINGTVQGSYEALAHLFVGGVVGAWLVTRARWLLVIGIGLTVVEVASAVASSFIH